MMPQVELEMKENKDEGESEARKNKNTPAVWALVVLVGLILDAHAVELMTAREGNDLDGGGLPKFQKTNGTNFTIR